MSSSWHHSKNSTLLYIKKGLHQKWWHAEFAYGSANQSTKIESSYIKHNFMHMEGQVWGPGFYRKLDVMVKLPTVLADMIKILKRKFTPLRPVCFPIHSLKLVDH